MRAVACMQQARQPRGARGALCMAMHASPGLAALLLLRACMYLNSLGYLELTGFTGRGVGVNCELVGGGEFGEL